MNLLWRFPFTCVTGLFATVIIVAILTFNLEVIHVRFFVAATGETGRLDDCLAALALFVVGFVIDWVLAARKAAALRKAIEIQNQRLHVLKATMRTVHDIVNNFLNSIQLVHLDAEESLPPEAAKLLDSLIQETTAKLRMLGDLESVPEKQLAMGIVIDYEKVAMSSDQVSAAPRPG